MSIVSHSFGGMVSVAYAAAFPDTVRRLVVIDGILRSTQELADKRAPASQRLARWVGQLRDMAARVASQVAGNDRMTITVRSQIPVGRGLGSSAALAAAAAAAAGAEPHQAFAVATKVDGHPENAAASVYGGLVAATLVDGDVTVDTFAERRDGADDDLQRPRLKVDQGLLAQGRFDIAVPRLSGHAQ